MLNVHELPVTRRINPDEERVVEEFDYSDFCALLEAGTAMAKARVNGMTILQFPRAVIICHDGHCTSITDHGASMEMYIRSALSELDRKTEAA